MVVLAVYVLAVLGCWWVWLRTDPDRPAASASTAPAPGRRTSPQRPLHGRAGRRREVERPPLTEDDVIAFGLALECAEDVVRWAIADPGPAPAEQQARRDVTGPA